MRVIYRASALRNRASVRHPERRPYYRGSRDARGCRDTLRRPARQRARNDCFLISCPEPGVRGRRQAPRVLRRLPPRRSRAAATSAPSDAALRFNGGLPPPDTANAAPVPRHGSAGRRRSAAEPERPASRGPCPTFRDLREGTRADRRGCPRPFVGVGLS